MSPTKLCPQITPTKFIEIYSTLLILLPPVLATSMAESNNATVIKRTQPTNPNKIASSSGPTPAIARTSGWSTVYAWGHNTKYSTVLFDENIIVKGFTLLDIKYPTDHDLSNEYVIIGLYTYALDRLDLESEKYSYTTDDDFMVFVRVGGVGRNFATVRFASTIPDDVEFNLKIFGVKV